MTYAPYGTVDEVAAKTSFTRDGQFFDYVAPDPTANPPVLEVFATKPSLTIVNLWLTEVSHQMDAALGSVWFNAPVDPGLYPSIVSLLADAVTTVIAEKVTAANNGGRLYELTKAGQSEIAITQSDLVSWVQAFQDGLVAMGLSQTRTPSTKEMVHIRYLGIPQLRRILPLQNRDS